MGTTRIKVIDLSGQEQEIKTSRKRAERLTAVAKLKGGKKAKAGKEQEKQELGITEGAEKEKESTESVPPAISPVPSAPKTTTQPRHQGKKYQTAVALIDSSKVYPASEAFALLAKTSYTKFDPTVEVHLAVTDKNMRGSVNFPHPAGAKRERRYLVFANRGPHPPLADGVIVIWGDEKTIADIETGKLKPGRDFDAVIASPKYMPSLARVAKILGPQGMMPNPKAGTITDNPSDLEKLSKSAGFEYRTDPTAGVIHTKIGKLSSKPEALSENLKALIAAIGPTKIKKAVIKSTMSPPVKLDLASIAAS